MPVYNTAPYLEEAISSVRGQTFTDWELICVDDGSTDGSYGILLSLQRQDGRIRIIRQQNLYAGVARNRGMEEARGKYILFPDSDDILKPKMLERLLAAIEKSNADFVKCRYEFFEDGTRKYRKAKDYSHYPKSAFSRPLSIDGDSGLLLGAFSAPWNAIYRRDFLVQNSIKFPPFRCVNDTAFYFEAAVKAKSSIVIDEYLYRYRVSRKGSLISQMTGNFACQAENYRLIAKKADELLDQNLARAAKIRYLEGYIYSFYKYDDGGEVRAEMARFLEKDVPAFLLFEATMRPHGYLEERCRALEESLSFRLGYALTAPLRFFYEFVRKLALRKGA